MANRPGWITFKSEAKNFLRVMMANSQRRSPKVLMGVDLFFGDILDITGARLAEKKPKQLKNENYDCNTCNT